MRIQIIPDDDVPSPKARGRGRPVDVHTQVQVNQFLAMKIGQSFFVQDAKSRDLEYLRRPIKKAGAGIRIIEVKQDEIYGTAGVRCWREAGEYDEL
jgi:hypothetical protein